MNQFTPPHRHAADYAFMLPDAVTFAQLIARLEDDHEITDTRKRDMISGLRRAAGALNRAPHEVVADPAWLQPRLVKVAPAALGLTSKSWQNTLSNARMAMAHSGIVRRRHRHIDDLTPEWRQLWARVLASKDKTLSVALPRLVHYFNRIGVAPQDVSQVHADAFLGLCCTNRVRDSSRESSVVAGMHEQTHTPDLQDHELAGL